MTSWKDEVDRTNVSQEQVESGLQCVICLDNMVEGEEVVRLQCAHHYHEPCISPWLSKSCVCPTCRRHVVSGEVLEEDSDVDLPISMWPQAVMEEIDEIYQLMVESSAEELSDNPALADPSTSQGEHQEERAARRQGQAARDEDLYHLVGDSSPEPSVTTMSFMADQRRPHSSSSGEATGSNNEDVDSDEQFAYRTSGRNTISGRKIAKPRAQRRTSEAGKSISANAGPEIVIEDSDSDVEYLFRTVRTTTVTTKVTVHVEKRASPCDGSHARSVDSRFCDESDTNFRYNLPSGEMNLNTNQYPRSLDQLGLHNGRRTNSSRNNSVYEPIRTSEPDSDSSSYNRRRKLSRNLNCKEGNYNRSNFKSMKRSRNSVVVVESSDEEVEPAYHSKLMPPSRGKHYESNLSDRKTQTMETIVSSHVNKNDQLERKRTMARKLQRHSISFDQIDCVESSDDEIEVLGHYKPYLNDNRNCSSDTVNRSRRHTVNIGETPSAEEHEHKRKGRASSEDVLRKTEPDAGDDDFNYDSNNTEDIHAIVSELYSILKPEFEESEDVSVKNSSNSAIGTNFKPDKMLYKDNTNNSTCSGSVQIEGNQSCKKKPKIEVKDGAVKSSKIRPENENCNDSSDSSEDIYSLVSELYSIINCDIEESDDDPVCFKNEESPDCRRKNTSFDSKGNPKRLKTNHSSKINSKRT